MDLWIAALALTTSLGLAGIAAATAVVLTAMRRRTGQED